MARAGKSPRRGRACLRTISSSPASTPAMEARAKVRNRGSKPATARRVAGSDPLKISTPRNPLIHPSVVLSIRAGLPPTSFAGIGMASLDTVHYSYPELLWTTGQYGGRSGRTASGRNLGRARHAGDQGPDFQRLPGAWMPEEEIRRALRALARARDGAALTDYGSPLGLPPLRQFLSRRMAEQGFQAAPDQILLTDSGTQAIDLVCRLLIQPGDAVLVDDPCYFNFLALLRAHGATVIGVPYTPAGPHLTLFAQALAEHRPRLYITNSGIHNPTGAALSPAAAHRLLKLVEDHDLVVVEDDIFADFETEPAPRLAALDGLDRVVRIGSFSKTLSASFRCGYIAGRPDWIEKLTDIRIATGFASNRLSEELVLGVLGSGGYRKHMEALRTRLAGAMARTIPRLRGLGIEPWIEPGAGMLVWCRLPNGLDAAHVA